MDVGVHKAASAIAGLVNAQSANTGVTADASTTATISNLKTTGTVGFTLQGTNSVAVNISATVTSTNLSALSQSINDQAGNTGITAVLSGDMQSIDLTQAEGADIKIGNYTHSSNTTADTITVTGNEGAGTVLTGNAGSQTNSSVIGGQVSFSSIGGFNISSDIAASDGSLFHTIATGANVSTLQSVDNIDITSVQGSADAIKSIDSRIFNMAREFQTLLQQLDYALNPRERHRASAVIHCGACEREVAGTASDRLRSGYCFSCYRKWIAQERPNRGAFEAEQKRLDAEG